MRPRSTHPEDSLTSVTGSAANRATIDQTSATAPQAAPAQAVERRADGGHTHAHRHAGSQTQAQTQAARRGRPGLTAVAAAETAGGLHLTREQEARFLADSARVFGLLKANDPSYTAPKALNRANAAAVADARPAPRAPREVGEKCNTNPRVSRNKAARQARAAEAKAQRETRAANDRRDVLDAFRDGLQPFSEVPAFQQCGRVPIPNSKVIGIPMTFDQTRARWRELQRCQRVHLCPTCGQEIRAERRAELETANTLWCDSKNDEGGARSVAMATFTLWHEYADSLKKLKAIQHLAWSRAFGRLSGKGWRDLREKWGIVGDVRIWETTWGYTNGWHPHWHVQYFLDRELTADQVQELEGELYKRWRDAVLKADGAEPSRERGVKLIAPKPGEDPKAFAQYMVKEMTGQGTKTGRKAGQRTPHQIAQDWLEKKKKRDLRLWHEYEEAVSGIQYMRWSDGLKARFGIDQKEEEKGGESGQKDLDDAPVVLSVSYTAWFNMIINHRGRSLAMRQAMEKHGIAGVQALVAAWNAEARHRWGPDAYEAVWGRDIWEPNAFATPEERAKRLAELDAAAKEARDKRLARRAQGQPPAPVPRQAQPALFC